MSDTIFIKVSVSLVSRSRVLCLIRYFRHQEQRLRTRVSLNVSKTPGSSPDHITLLQSTVYRLRVYNFLIVTSVTSIVSLDPRFRTQLRSGVGTTKNTNSTLIRITLSQTLHPYAGTSVPDHTPVHTPSPSRPQTPSTVLTLPPPGSGPFRRGRTTTTTPISHVGVGGETPRCHHY